MTQGLQAEFKGKAFALPTQARFIKIESVEQSMKDELKALQAKERSLIAKKREGNDLANAFSTAMKDFSSDNPVTNIANSVMVELGAPGIGAASGLFEVCDAVMEMSGADNKALMESALNLAEQRKPNAAKVKALIEKEYARMAQDKDMPLLDRNTAQGVHQRRLLLQERLEDIAYAKDHGLSNLEVNGTGIQLPANMKRPSPKPVAMRRAQQMRAKNSLAMSA